MNLQKNNKQLKLRAIMTCSMMPNQIEGTINGIPFYYRARHGYFSLEITKDDGTEIVIDSGESKRAGWWEKRTAFRRLRRSIYRAAKGGFLRSNVDKLDKAA